MEFSPLSSLSSGMASLSGFLGSLAGSPNLGGQFASQYRLLLGDFEFSDMEIPEMLAVGGDQQTIVHKLIGGARVIDQLGPDARPLEWRGVILGSNAVDRAAQLATMRKAGGQYVLSFAQLRYNVAILTINFDVYAFNRIGFEIVCIEIPPPDPTSVLSDVDAAINGDMTTASGLATSINDTGINGGITTLQSAIAGVSSFAKATTAQINSVLSPLASLQSQVKTLSVSINNTVKNVTTLGGILPNNPVAKSASSMLNQMNSLTQLSNCYALQSVLGRIGGNVQSASGGTSPKKITVSGGDLMAIAQQQYGDATQWTKIAQANGLSDPKLSGTNTLVIPK